MIAALVKANIRRFLDGLEARALFWGCPSCGATPHMLCRHEPHRPESGAHLPRVARLTTYDVWIALSDAFR